MVLLIFILIFIGALLLIFSSLREYDDFKKDDKENDLGDDLYELDWTGRLFTYMILATGMFLVIAMIIMGY